MITTLEPTVKELPVIESLCQHEPIAPLPQGKAAVLQDQFLELLKEADSLMKYSKTTKTRGDEPHSVKLGDKSRYITLEASDDNITGEVWTKSGEYVRLTTIVKARVDTYFRIAVDLEVLKLTVAIASKYERIDMVVNSETNTLSLMQSAQDRYGNMRIGWRSNFKGLAAIELCEPVDSKPAPVYTKEQKKEFKWLSKSVDATKARWTMMFAHASKDVNGTPFVATADGYRAHYTMNHAAGLDGYIDIKNNGPLPDGRFPDVDYVASRITGQKVNVFYADLLKAVKAVMKVKPDADIATFEFKGNVLTITTKSFERGEAVAHILCSKGKNGKFAVNGKFIIDALAGCDGIPNRKDKNLQSTVMFQFNEPNEPVRVIPHVGRMAILMPAKVRE